MKKRFFIVSLLVIAFVLSITANAAYRAVYNRNTSDPTFTVMGSLQGNENDSGYYSYEYGTIRVDANTDNPTYSRLFCYVRLFAMKNGNQVRVDNNEISNRAVMMNSYAGTEMYYFDANTVNMLSASYSAGMFSLNDYTPNNPSSTLVLD